MNKTNNDGRKESLELEENICKAGIEETHTRLIELFQMGIAGTILDDLALKREELYIQLEAIENEKIILGI